MADKVSIKTLIKQDDAFFTTSERLMNYASANKNLLIGLGVALLVLLIGAAVWQEMRTSKTHEARLAYETATDLLQAGNEDAVKALEKVRTDFSGTPESRLATLTMVSVHITEKRYDQAKPLIEELLKTIPLADEALKGLLLNSLAGIYEVEGSLEKAAENYQAALPLAIGNLKADTLMSLGRVCETLGRKEEAAKAYQDVITQFPNSPKYYIAKQKLATLEAGAGQPAAKAEQPQAPAEEQPKAN